MTIDAALMRWRLLLSRITGFFSADTKLHNARFAHLHELKNLLSDKLNEKPSLLLGISRFNQVLRVTSTEKRRELGNVLITAPTRGGKSIALETQLRVWPHSVIVNDPKGELFTKTAGYRLDNEIYVFDPTGKGHRHDPLLGKTTEDDLYAVAKTLLHEPTEKDPVFTQKATKMLTLLFLAARIRGYSPFPFVSDVSKYGINTLAKTISNIDAEIANRLLDGEYNPNKDYSEHKFLIDSWESLTARLYPFLTETVIRSLAGSDFSISDLLLSEKPVTIYLRWPESKLLALQPLIKLIWGNFIEELTAVYDNTNNKEICRPVLLLVDEAGICPIPELQKHVTTVNGRGISFMIAIQALSQLDAIYGKYHASTIRNNMESQIYYRQADLETAQYLKERLGDKSGFAHSNTTHEGQETSAGESEREIPLMSAQEIMQMSDEEIIGFHRGLRPFRAKRMDWRRFPLLEHRQHIPPPPLPILPPLDERPPDQAGGSTKQESSWRLAPDLLRWGSQPAAANGLRKNISHDGEAGLRP
jgi:type IV secretion system protein VirD4